MKILHVLPYFHPAWFFGGPVKVLYDVTGELAKRGHQVVIYTSDIKDAKSRVMNDVANVNGVSVYYFKNVSILAARKKIFITPSMLSAVRNSLDFFDVTHIHGYVSFQNPLLYYYLQKKRIPYVIQAHGALYGTGVANCPKSIYDLFIGNRILKGASKLIALNQMEAAEYNNRGVFKEKIEIIPNGIDLSSYANLSKTRSMFKSFREKFNIGDDKRIILYLGRIHRTKGIDLLITAYAYLINKMGLKDTVLVIAGPDDGYLAEIKTLASSLNVSDSIVFTGFISSEEKLEVLSDADVFVTPSFYGFPITFLEACVTGTPIVTTTMGETLEWIDGNVGFVTSPSYHDLANAIRTILSNDELAARFSRNCRKLASTEFSLDRIVDRLEEVYKEAIACKA